jgi:catechol 2,3-dioxygenase-like lactoylglutathione lyase family enzyme
MPSNLVPELDVSRLEASLDFYIGCLGFEVLYRREHEGFAMIAHEGVRLMLEQADSPSRHFRTAALEHPYGRGINFQITISDVDAIHDRAVAAGHAPLIPLEDRWYLCGPLEQGQRQFVIADPDGYLLRFCSDLGSRAPAQRP